MCAVLLAAFYTGCADPHAPHAAVIKECGPPPQAPGLVAAFEEIPLCAEIGHAMTKRPCIPPVYPVTFFGDPVVDRRAILSVSTYLEIKEYEAAVGRWAACVQRGRR